jgi:hypothetical protein
MWVNTNSITGRPRQQINHWVAFSLEKESKVCPPTAKMLLLTVGMKANPSSWNVDYHGRNESLKPSGLHLLFLNLML